MNLIKVIIYTTLLSTCNLSFAQENSGYKILYEANEKGEALYGNLNDLVAHVQNGNPVRVGWVLKFKAPNQDWADAGFITTLGNHVFAQISSIYQQGPILADPKGIALVNDQPDGWVAILGSTGVMRQKYARNDEMISFMKESGMTDEQIDKQLKEEEIMQVHTKWAVMIR